MLLTNEQDAQGLSSEQYTLTELQEALVKFGPDHFNQRGSNPLHYLQVLLLTGQFERVGRVCVCGECGIIRETTASKG